MEDRLALNEPNREANPSLPPSIFAMHVAIEGTVWYFHQARLQAQLMPCALATRGLAEQHLILAIRGVLRQCGSHLWLCMAASG